MKLCSTKTNLLMVKENMFNLHISEYISIRVCIIRLFLE